MKHHAQVWTSGTETWQDIVLSREDFEALQMLHEKAHEGHMWRIAKDVLNRWVRVRITETV